MLTRWEASKAKYCTAIVGQRSAVEGCCELEGVFVSEVTRLRICQLLFVPGAKRVLVPNLWNNYDFDFRENTKLTFR